MTHAASSLPLPETHVPRGALGRSRRGRIRAWVLVAVHVAALVHIAHWRVAGKTLSPVEPSEARETLELGYVNAGFVLLILALLATLVLGRFFCGWACHVVAYQDAAAWLLARLGLRPRAVRSRLLLLVPVLAACDLFLVPLLRRWTGDHPRTVVAAFVTDDLWATFPGATIAALTFLVDGFLLVWFLGAKGFCTNACPYGALFACADRAAPGRVRVTDACEGCGHCTATCTSNVRVHEEVARFGKVVDPGCMRCLDCVSVCPKDALYFGFRAKVTRAPAPLRGRSVAWDFTWPEELALALLAVLGVLSFRGLYHAVPFMLALGLGVLFAVASLVLLRLVTRRDLRFQHWCLRASGRLTRAGAVAAALSLALVSLTLHSTVVRASTQLGLLRLERAQASAGSMRSEQLASAAAHLGRAQRLGLVVDAQVAHGLGSIDLAAGRYDRARRQLERAIDAAPRLIAPRLALAEGLLAQRDWAGARDVLDALLALAPRDEHARWRRAQAAIGLRDFEQAEALLSALVADAPRHAQAAADLERVRAVLGRDERD